MTFDVTTNRSPFGLLTSEEKEKLMAWPHGLLIYCSSSNSWHTTHNLRWFNWGIYRGSPKPREPKTIWVNTFASGKGCSYKSESEAREEAPSFATSIAVKYQEVI